MRTRDQWGTIWHVDSLNDTREPVTAVVQVEFRGEREQPHGHVGTGNGRWHPFWGWLELMQTLEDALATSDATAGVSATRPADQPTAIDAANENTPRQTPTQPEERR